MLELMVIIGNLIDVSSGDRRRWATVLDYRRLKRIASVVFHDT